MLTHELRGAAMHNINAHDRVIDRHELNRLVPYSLTHIGRLERLGRFPGRISLGANRVGWSRQEILEWIEQKKREREP
jgi:predicted DNA-binding transcriptional regulator AlpA